jgi:hypothetical protein
MAEIPATARRPRDRQKPAAQVEAEAVGTIEVQYDDITLTFPADMDEIDGDVLDALDDQKLSHVLRALLVNGEWERFKATRPKAKDYPRLFNLYAVQIGLNSAGE